MLFKVFCDFIIREPNHPKESHRYTVQCVLPFNLFNQQIFTYLYFWLLILSCFNLISMIIWLYRLSPYHNFRHLERRLATHILNKNAKHDDDDNDMRKKFVYRYLQGDGTFMLYLVTSNVSDYVCKRILFELYQVFCESDRTKRIGRESLFQPIFIEHDQDENDNNLNNIERDQNENMIDVDDDGSTDQTVAADLPPIPNPRQGRIFIERDSFSKLSSDIQDIEQHNVEETNEKLKMPTNSTGQQRFRSSLTPLLKDIHRISEVQTDSSESTTAHYKNVDIQFEPDMPLSPVLPPATVPPTYLPPPPPPPALKGPSPYATTYLTNRKRNEHELPYIDDSLSSSSMSSRLAHMSTSRSTEKPKPKPLSSTNIFFRRSHDV